ncbi:MAG: hypothetical protein QGH83_06840, partial [Candidatus Pacebacteria bacterium]|nr:hypothetical protein [Candidatus Paceibacterota bacterium]
GDGSGLTNLPSQTANDFTNTLKTKLDNVEANATADQTKTDIEALGIDISGTMSGHIIPGTNSVYDIGSAEYKVRHLFLSDNSLWVGDDHKVTVEGGKKKYKKRKKGIVPAGVQTLLITSVFADTAALLINFKAQIHDPAPSNELDPDHADFNPPTSKWQEFLVLHGHPNKLVDDIYNTATDFDDEKEETDKATTEGDIVYFDGSVYKRLPLGAEGQVLLANGDGTAPEWGDNGVGVGRNIAINGAMLVAQRGTSTTNELYGTVDRFNKQSGGTDEAVTQSQADVASGTTPYSQGFRKTFRLTNGNQTSGAGVTDYAAIYYYLEGQDISRSGWDYTSSSSYITLSYWVKASVAQTYYARFRAYASSQYEYSWSMALSANTWTKITVSIPGNSNLANLVSTTTIGAFIQWVPFYGTNYTASGHTLNSWAVKDNNSAFPDYTSTWWTTDDSTFEITGVKLEVGSSATNYEHKSYGEELALCQRYFQLPYNWWGYSDASTNWAWKINHTFPVEMRASPTMTANGTCSTAKMNANAAGPNSITSPPTANKYGFQAGYTYVHTGTGVAAVTNTPYQGTGGLWADAEL